MYRSITLIAGFFLTTFPALSQEAAFEGLGDLPGAQYWSVAHDVTADGSVVVGFSDADWGQEGFRWEDGEMESLGDLPGGGVFAWGYGVSDDGTIAVGYSYSANGSDPAPLEAFRWVDGVMSGLGFLPGGNNVSGSYDVSADGSVVAAYGQSANGLEAARWTEGEGIVGLGDFDSGSFSSASRAVSADGSTIVGRGNTENGWQAFRWTEDEGMVGIGTLDDDPYLSVAEDASGNGSVIVGYSNTTEGYRAFRWTEVGGMENLGDLPGGEDFSVARDISDDGSTIVGESSTEGDTEFGEQVAFIWKEEDGMRNLNEVLEEDYGLDLTGWTLTNAHATSEDGIVIVGSGTNPEGDTEAWQAVLGFPIADGETPEHLPDVLSAPSPNPARAASTVTVSVEESQHVAVEVFDVTGRRVQTLYNDALAVGMSETLALDASALSAGLYVIRAVGEDFIERRRLTIAR